MLDAQNDDSYFRLYALGVDAKWNYERDRELRTATTSHVDIRGNGILIPDGTATRMSGFLDYIVSVKNGLVIAENGVQTTAAFATQQEIDTSGVSERLTNN